MPHIFSVEKFILASHPVDHTTKGLSPDPQDADPYLCHSYHSIMDHFQEDHFPQRSRCKHAKILPSSGKN